MIKILDITTSLKTGGMANGLLQTLRHLDRKRYHFSIFASYTGPPSITAELENIGVEIIQAPDHYASPLKYFKAFWGVMKHQGPFDIVHAHPYTSCGIFMMLAKWHGVPVRITHVHNDHRTREASQGLYKKFYSAFMRCLIRRYASAGIAVSENAAESIFGQNWRSDPRWQVIYGGTDFQAFQDKAIQPISGLAKPEGPVIALSGRLTHAKNPHFALEVFQELLALEPNAKLLVIGDGELRSALENRIKQAGIMGSVIMAGMRSDVPALLHQYCDALLLPSFHEGLPRAAVEAQAAGLPVLTSTHVTRECDYTGRVSFMDLSAPPHLWAQTLAEMLRAGKTPFESAIHHARQSHFDIHVHASRMSAFYDDQIKRRI